MNALEKKMDTLKNIPLVILVIVQINLLFTPYVYDILKENGFKLINRNTFMWMDIGLMSFVFLLVVLKEL